MTEIISTIPKTIINDKIHIRDHHLSELIQSIPADFSYVNFHDPGAYVHYDPELSQKAFLYVISCTVFNYPSVFNSEKNFKPIVNLRPFVLVSSPGGLASMRNMGFKTFGNFWSEEYDGIIDPVERMTEIVKIIDQVSQKSITELKDMLIDMQDILTHNYNFYYNSFKDQELAKFELSCQRNRGGR